mmetsp:Transcript_67467/g.181535  ORF Transcript_67467/g.181535 Transcript_67467/m.181535 type:complete len:246 (+) Transcript_67467:1-738(+)
MWPTGQENATHLRVQGDPWLQLAAATVRCQMVARLLASGHEAAEWCILLAGWDNTTFPVAALPLPHGPGRPPPAGVTAGVLAPAAAVPVNVQARGSAVVALHIEALTGRLWAVWANGELQAWDLLGSRSVGIWRPPWPWRGDPVGVAICSVAGRGGFATDDEDAEEAAEFSLFVLAAVGDHSRSGTSGVGPGLVPSGPSGPAGLRLARARLPRRLLEAAGARAAAGEGGAGAASAAPLGQSVAVL